MQEETYTVTRLDTWDDETWEEVCETIEAVVATFGEDG